MKSSLMVLTVGFMFFSSSVFSMTQIPVPMEPIYFEPPIVEPDDQVRQATCVEIDNAINQLHPYRYTYKPNFYRDRTNSFASTLVVFDVIPIVEGWLGLAYLGYSSILEEKESRRMQSVEQQIAMLQRVKAEKRCFQ